MMVHVSFEHDEGQILSIYAENYPPYRPGDTIWLEIQQTPIGEQKFPNVKTMRLTRFEVEHIDFGVFRTHGSSNIVDSESMDVYLKSVTPSDVTQ